MPRIYKLQKLDGGTPIWKHFPHEKNHAYWVGENEESARRNAANGSTPSGKLASASPWMDSKATSCVLDYDSSANRLAGVEDQQ